jgi:hypothetical protein
MLMPRKDGPKAKLGWLDDAGEFHWVPADGPNRVAAESTVGTLATEFTDADQALVTGFVMLAEAIDADPTNAALWGQYRAAEAAVREVASRGDDDEFSRIMADLSASIRDTEVAEP